MDTYHVAWLLVCVALLALAGLLATLWLSSSPIEPRVRPRSLPSLPGTPTDVTQASEPMIVRVAGRAYQVAGAEGGVASEACPWCLGSLDGAEAGEIVRCDRPYCRQAAHRRHNLEHGGCGGMCSIVGG